jgi:hypothetical protein
MGLQSLCNTFTRVASDVGSALRKSFSNAVNNLTDKVVDLKQSLGMVTPEYELALAEPPRRVPSGFGGMDC